MNVRNIGTAAALIKTSTTIEYNKIKD